MPDVVSYVNCHNTRQLDDSGTCGLLVVRGFLLIDHLSFAPVPYQTTPLLYTAYTTRRYHLTLTYMYLKVTIFCGY